VEGTVAPLVRMCLSQIEETQENQERLSVLLVQLSLGKPLSAFLIPIELEEIQKLRYDKLDAQVVENVAKIDIYKKRLKNINDDLFKISTAVARLETRFQKIEKAKETPKTTKP
jgi:hypothetical protein